MICSETPLRQAGAVLAMSLAAVAATPAAGEDAFAVTTTGGSARGFIKATVEAFHGILRETIPGASATFKPSSVAGGMVDVANGEADVAFAIPPVELQAAMAGRDPFPTSLEGELLAMMTIVDHLEFYFVADAAWAEAHGVSSLADLAEKKPPVNINLSERGTFYAIRAAEALFEAHGFTPEDVEDWGGSVVYSPSGAQFDNLRDGKVDIVINASFSPDGRILNIVETKDLAWIAPGDAELAEVAEMLDLRVGVAEASAYPFLKSDQGTLMARLTMASGEHVADETVHRFVKAIDENQDRVQAVHPSLQGFSREVMLDKPALIPWHPGAERYWREVGAIE